MSMKVIGTDGSLGHPNRGMTLLSSVSIAAGATDVSFTSIPQIYTDLMVVIKNIQQSASTSGSAAIIRFNSDATAGNYRFKASGLITSTATELSAATATAYGTQSNRDIAIFVGDAPAGSNAGGTSTIIIRGYAGSGYKPVVAWAYAGQALTFSSFTNGSYISSSPITSISFTRNGTGFTYSSGIVELWGVI
jgi:hypothetical protein